MAGFNATLDQVEQMIESGELTQVQEAKRMLDELCLPADYKEFTQKAGGFSLMPAIVSGDPELMRKLVEKVILGLATVVELYHMLALKFRNFIVQAGRYSKEGNYFIQQLKSCYQATLELAHEIDSYQEFRDFILLRGYVELAQIAGLENNTELFQKYLKACYELPDQPDDPEFMSMKQTARELPKQFEPAPAPSVIKRATNSKPKSATNPPSSTSGGINQRIIGIIAALVIVLLLLYACGAT